MQLKPYVQVQANIVSNLRLLNLWIANLTFDLDQFTWNAFLSLIVNENFELCPGFGVENETILLKVLWTMKFWNCSKTLVDDLADFSSTWTGYEAKYFQDCSQSNNAEVIFYEKEIKESSQDGASRGTVYAKSTTYCVALFGSNSGSLSNGTRMEDEPANIVAKMAYKTFFNWAVDTYPASF